MGNNLTPIAHLMVESRNGMGEALVFERSKRVEAFTGTVDGAASDEGALDMLTVDIFDLTLSERAAIKPNGMIVLEAGYEDVDAPKQGPLFVGQLDNMYSFRDGFKLVTRLIAHTNGPEVVDIHYRGDLSGLTIGKALDLVARKGGASVIVPGSAFEHFIEDFTANGSVIDVMTMLVEALSYATRRPHVLAPVHSGVLEGGSGSGSARVFRVSDLGRVDSDAVLTLDVLTDFVLTGMPVVNKPEGVDPTLKDDDGEAVIPVEETSALNYDLTTMLHPGIALGVPCIILDDEVGGGLVTGFTNRVHDLENWTTTASGPFVRDDIVPEGDHTHG